MILQTYHPTVSSTGTIRYEGGRVCEKTTVTTFNQHYMDQHTQGLLCDLYETIIINYERVLQARNRLVSARDFNPHLLFQSMAEKATVVAVKGRKPMAYDEFCSFIFSGSTAPCEYLTSTKGALTVYHAGDQIVGRDEFQVLVDKL